MLETGPLVAAMIAGATTVGPQAVGIAGAELAKEATKDAYLALKTLLAAVCGRRAGRAADALEADPSSEEARTELSAAIGSIPGDDAAEIDALLRTLIRKLGDDAGARRVAAEAGRIKLDVDSGGHVTLERIDGPADIDVKARSTGDFVLRDVHMGGGSRRGN